MHFAYPCLALHSLGDRGGYEIGQPHKFEAKIAIPFILAHTHSTKERIEEFENLRDAVTSPGGTTAAGLAVFKQADFRGLVNKVITAAHDRSIELGKK